MKAAEIGDEIVSVPLREILEKVTKSIVETQEKLDEESLKVTTRMSGVNPEDRVEFGTTKYSLLELGFVPSFYKLSETEVDLKLALSMSRSETDRSLNIFGSTIDSRYANVYGFQEGSASVIKAKLVPLPTPNIYESRVTEMLEEVAQEQFEVTREYVVNRNMNDLTMEQLEKMRLKNLVAENLPEYRVILRKLEPDDIPDIPSLQAHLNRANAIMLIRFYAEENDARAMTIREVFDTGVTGSIERNLKGYRRRVEEMSSITDLEIFQTLIDQVNAFLEIHSLMEIRALPNLSFELLKATNVLRLEEEKLEGYRNALALVEVEPLAEFHFAALQTLVDQVNEN